MNSFLLLIKSEKFKGVVAILAAVAMYYTPNHIDLIIEMCLAAFGIQKLTIKSQASK